MTLIDRTAYPRFSRGLPAKKLHVSFSPDLGEIEWARKRTYSDEGLLSLLVSLKSLQRLDIQFVPARDATAPRKAPDLADRPSAAQPMK